MSGKLSWSHYCELLSVSDKEKRSFYEKEAVNSGWFVRELRRQMESSLFERLLLSRGDANKEQVLSLAEKGVDYTKPEDIIKDPYVFEFLGLPEEKPFLESDLEAALVRQIEDFLLELGRGTGVHHFRFRNAVLLGFLRHAGDQFFPRPDRIFLDGVFIHDSLDSFQFFSVFHS